MENAIGLKSLVFYNSKTYDLLAVHRCQTYELYIAPSDGSFALSFMYAVPESEKPEEVMRTAENNAGQYIESFRKTEWV